jgi:hypothetical protein
MLWPCPFIQTKATVDERGQVIRDEDGLGNYAQPGYDANANVTPFLFVGAHGAS